jgi:hypothetical protein
VKRRRIESVDAWSHFRRAAGAIAVQGWNEDSVAEALHRVNQALVIDPDFALARAFLALVNAFGANLSLVPDIEFAKKGAREEAEHAITIDPNASDVSDSLVALLPTSESMSAASSCCDAPSFSIQATRRRTWRWCIARSLRSFR